MISISISQSPCKPQRTPVTDRVAFGVQSLFGFSETDTIQVASDMTGRFKRCESEMSLLTDANVPTLVNLWIGPNPLKPDAKGYRKERIAEIRWVCVDIDYDEPGHHKRPTSHPDLDAALLSLSKLPEPTFTLLTGGGVQAFWRFLAPLPNDENNRARAETLGRKFAAVSCSDPVQSVEHVFRLPYSSNCKTQQKKTVEMYDYTEYRYAIDELESAVAHITIEPAATKSEANAAKDDDGTDRSVVACTIIRDLYESGVVEERVILARLKQSECWGHYTSEDHARQDIRRVIGKVDAERQAIRPANPVIHDKYDTWRLSDNIKAMRDAFFEKCYKPRRSIDHTLSVLEQCHQDKTKALVPAKCGHGKTTSMTILAATYASPDNRFLVVRQKVQDVVATVEHLKTLGCRDVVAWHGHCEGICNLTHAAFVRHRASGRLPCTTCQTPCAARAKYASEHPLEPHGDIVVITHAWVRAMLSAKTTAAFAQIIIDEEPDTFEEFEFTDHVNALLRDHLPQNIRDDYRRWFAAVEDAVSDGGGRRIPLFTALAKADAQTRTRQILNLRLRDGRITDDGYGKVSEFLSFVQAQTQEHSFGFCQYRDGMGQRGRIITLITSKLDFTALPPTIILNGSADLSFVTFAGFTLLEQSAFATEYPNTNVRVVMGNPSQRNLSNADFFKRIHTAAEDGIRASGASRLILFANKDLHSKRNGARIAENIARLRDSMKAQGVEVRDMTCGQHIGSNLGQDDEGCVIAMGLFRNLSWYVLRACLTTRSEITPDRIWRKVFTTPNMLRSGGYADRDIQRIFALASAYDIEQAVMRGRIRQDPSAIYTSCVIASSLDVISALTRKFNKAHFDFDDAWILEKAQAGASISSIATAIREKKDLKNWRAVQKAKEIIKRFHCKPD